MKLSKQGRDAAALYTEKGRADLAAEEAAQAEVIESYLPKQLSPEELESEIRVLIADTGAASMKDMGRVMSLASKQLAGRAEGKAISEVVKRLLS